MAADHKKPEIILLHETVFESVARDLLTFGVLCGATWFINVYAGASGWLNFLLALVWFLWMAGRAQAHRIRRTPDEARAWLDEHFPREPDMPVQKREPKP